nr:MAG TPA: SemiSWEET, PQLC, membrane protein, sugar [Caudoviricetes sp.]
MSGISDKFQKILIFAPQIRIIYKRKNVREKY